MFLSKCVTGKRLVFLSSFGTLGLLLYLRGLTADSLAFLSRQFGFRNSPTFYDIADPELVSAYQETEAYIDYVHNHASAPPFVCTSLLKHFGYSNPSPRHTLACSEAFKSGVFSFTNPEDTNDSVSFGVAGQRGNLAAVAASIVLSDDALTATADVDPAAGAIKSPLLKITQAMRSFKLTWTLHHRRIDGFFSAGLFGEGPYDVPDQFSFYDPFHMPAGAHREAFVSEAPLHLLR